MRNLKRIAQAITWIAAILLCASPSFAKRQDVEKPKPAARDYSLLPEATENQQDTDTIRPSLQPDNLPLSGIQNPTVGTAEVRHSYWVPGIRYSNTLRSNSSNPTTGSGWNTTNFVSTDLSLLQAWSHSTLSMDYSGGGYFSTDALQGNGQYQQLATSYQIEQRRWQLLFMDQFSYLPESSFGLAGPSGVSTPGVAGALAVPLPSFQTGYIPGQTILSTIGPRYSNSGAAQLTYKLSARGSFTVAGVYGILRFVDGGNVNSDTETFNAGYDYALTARDTIGVSYRFGAYRYPGDPQALGDHSVQVEYGRKITGKMALKVGGGPEITTLRVPVGGVTDRISGAGTASLVYSFATTSNVTLHYMHGVSGGSGVFSGATSDQVGAMLAKRLTPAWNGTLNLDYARNRQLLTAGSVPGFDSWAVGAGVNRSLGRTAYFSIGYQTLIEQSGAAAASTNYTTNQVFLSFQWHSRPLILR